VSAGLSEIVWLLTQSRQHKQAFFIGDLEWMAMPPILLQQFRMFYAKDKPIGVILWAYVNDEVEQRLLSGDARMAPRTGSAATSCGSSRCWPPSAAPTRCSRTSRPKVFKNRELRFRAVEAAKGVARLM
jgi:cytolysin-activating lysine-acyltransferase